MRELTKEIQENVEIAASEKCNIPDFTPKGEMSLDKANAIFDKFTEEIFSLKNESEHVKESLEIEDVYNEIYDCSKNDFSFEDLDLEDKRLEKIIEYFEPERWRNMDMIDKKSVIRAFEMYLAEKIDLKRIPRVDFYYGSQDDWGAYVKAYNKIKINMNIMDDPKKAIGTIAHEVWHAYQHQRADKPQTRKDALYAVNFINYIMPVMVDGKLVMFKEYESQLVEAEANTFAKLFEDKVGGSNGCNS